MSKKHGNHVGQRRKFQRSDIPYKDRLLMDKYTNTRDQRNDAARIAMKVSCVALNDSLGLGFQRLCRYADVAAELFRLYYSDPEYQEEKLNQRLRLMGFTVTDDGSCLAWQKEDGSFITLEEFAKEGPEDEQVPV